MASKSVNGQIDMGLGPGSSVSFDRPIVGLLTNVWLLECVLFLVNQRICDNLSYQGPVPRTVNITVFCIVLLLIANTVPRSFSTLSWLR